MSQEHNRSDNERFYDEEIAPVLLALANKCGEKGMAFVSAVEYAPGERSQTSMLGENPGLAMVMLNHCAKMGENIDGYIMGLARYAEANGISTDSSMVMNFLKRGQLS